MTFYLQELYQVFPPFRQLFVFYGCNIHTNLKILIMPVINVSLFLYEIYIYSVLEFPFVKFGSACRTVSIKYMRILKCFLFIIFENFIHLDNSSGYSSLSQETGRRETIKTLWQNESLTIWVLRVLSTDKVIYKIKTVQWVLTLRADARSILYLLVSLNETSFPPFPLRNHKLSGVLPFQKAKLICVYLGENARVKFSLFIIL